MIRKWLNLSTRNSEYGNDQWVGTHGYISFLQSAMRLLKTMRHPKFKVIIPLKYKVVYQVLKSFSLQMTKFTWLEEVFPLAKDICSPENGTKGPF
ncbi:hypothetical protein Hanom_Chr16g01481451 [Helianthus anomalus]